MVTAGGPVYGPLLEMDSARVRQALSDHVVLSSKLPGTTAISQVTVC
jgi:hypothetical protein